MSLGKAHMKNGNRMNFQNRRYPGVTVRLAFVRPPLLMASIPFRRAIPVAAMRAAEFSSMHGRATYGESVDIVTIIT